jgi:hypothetical protein
LNYNTFEDLRKKRFKSLWYFKIPHVWLVQFDIFIYLLIISVEICLFLLTSLLFNYRVWRYCIYHLCSIYSLSALTWLLNYFVYCPFFLKCHNIYILTCTTFLLDQQYSIGLLENFVLRQLWPYFYLCITSHSVY